MSEWQTLIIREHLGFEDIILGIFKDVVVHPSFDQMHVLYLRVGQSGKYFLSLLGAHELYRKSLI
jgi:hypothetical protein